MSWTRFHDDPVRMTKEVEMSTYSGNYALNKPGPGIDLPFWEDTQIRMEKWGANLHNGFSDIESELKGIGQKLTKHPDPQQYQRLQQLSSNITYKPSQPFVEESRTSHPAWQYRGMDRQYSRWENPWLNPQAKLATEKQFLDNVHTRLVEKDKVREPK